MVTFCKATVTSQTAVATQKILVRVLFKNKIQLKVENVRCEMEGGRALMKFHTKTCKVSGRIENL